MRTNWLITWCDRSPAVTASSVPKHRLRHCGRVPRDRQGLGRAQQPVRLFSAHDKGISSCGETRPHSRPASWLPLSVCPLRVVSKRAPAPSSAAASGQSRFPGGLVPELLQGSSTPSVGLIFSSTCHKTVSSRHLNVPPHLAASPSDSPRPPSMCGSRQPPCPPHAPHTPRRAARDRGCHRAPPSDSEVSFLRPPRSPL